MLIHHALILEIQSIPQAVIHQDILAHGSCQKSSLSTNSIWIMFIHLATNHSSTVFAKKDREYRPRCTHKTIDKRLPSQTLQSITFCAGNCSEGFPKGPPGTWKKTVLIRLHPTKIRRLPRATSPLARFSQNRSTFNLSYQKGQQEERGDLRCSTHGLWESA